jgi:anion-transporting  ArsA/GET3 family ATPase
MTGILDRPLVLVTGKGGVGKSTVAAALGRAAAAAGLKTMVCEVGAQARVARLLGAGPGALGDEQEVEGGLWTLSIDPDDALKAWLAKQLGSRSLVNILTRSNLFSYFVAAAPGARELVSTTKVWELAQRPRWNKGDPTYDVVIADLPATGHALAMLRAPKTFNDIARIGPIASQAGAVARSLADPAQTAIVAVTVPGELPVSETLDLQDRTVQTLGRELDLVVANDVLSARWTPEQATELGSAGVAVAGRVHGAVSREAARAAVQQAQLHRLRAGVRVPVLTLPHLTTPSLGPEDVRTLAEDLSDQLTGVRITG